MEVLERGNMELGWTKEIRCTGKGHGNKGCYALLRISRFDVYNTRTQTRTCYGYTQSRSAKTIRCPECDTETNVTVPDGVKTFGKARQKQ